MHECEKYINLLKFSKQNTSVNKPPKCDFILKIKQMLYICVLYYFWDFLAKKFVFTKGRLTFAVVFDVLLRNWLSKEIIILLNLLKFTKQISVKQPSKMRIYTENQTNTIIFLYFF